MAQVLASMIQLLRRKNRMYPMYVDLPHSRIFTLFFPSMEKNASVLVYNPGGPGASGLPQIFESFAPVVLSGDDEGIKMVKNSDEYDLTRRFHLLYIDIPTDTGYSIAKTEDILYGDTQSVGEAIRVIKAVLRVQKRFVGDNPIIDFFGFSYAGKIWPLIAKELIQDGYRIGGLALFSGYTDPILQEIRPLMEYLLYTGFISSSEYIQLERMTDEIERRIRQDPSGKSWRTTQKLYIQTVTSAWEIASADTYDIAHPIPIDDDLDTIFIPRSYKDDSTQSLIDMDILLNDPLVMKALGVKTPYIRSASTFSIESYQGFLTSATDALKFLADKGILILYIMGSLDGATLAKGTKDMMESIFKTKLQEKRWVIDPSMITDDEHASVLLGKITRVSPNVYYGTVIGSGHSLNTGQGAYAFITAMDYLYRRKGPSI